MTGINGESGAKTPPLSHSDFNIDGKVHAFLLYKLLFLGNVADKFRC